MKIFFKVIPIVIFVVVVFSFFKDFLFKTFLPIPLDTITGLYHPWRDLFSGQFPNGMPFKNFLITDPVRQLIPWRELSLSLLKKGELPTWNPYSFAGTPLLANFQSAPLYPLNILFFVLPFPLGWSLLVVLQPLLGGLFLYRYLRNLKVEKIACLLGAIVFAFSGFSIAWLEWNTVIHTLIWLPLILLSTDKVIEISKLKFQNLIWLVILTLSLSSSLFAGHLQTFFYVFLISVVYLILRWWQSNKQINILSPFAFCFLIFAIVTSVQWLPTLQFIQLSARNIDKANWQVDGWFIPWQHLVQFIIPDFFGNPTTLNYWGVWNYGEFVGYLGIAPLILAVFCLLFRKDKKTLFWGSIFFLGLLLATPTPLAKIPYVLQIPFLSTAQPTRLLSIIDFSLAILAALGFDYLFKNKKEEVVKKIVIIILVSGLLYAVAWIFLLTSQLWLHDAMLLSNLEIARKNTILPTFLFFVSSLVLLTGLRMKRHTSLLYIIIVTITVFDLFRFGWKFLPFTKQEYLFPQTKVLEFLQKQPGPFRVMTTNSEILPPNFNIYYRIQTVSGYDPLYLKSYAELVSMWEKGKPDPTLINFNRIVEPHDPSSFFVNLLNVKYILSFEQLPPSAFREVMREGRTIVYENPTVLPRAYLTEGVIKAASKEEAAKALFTPAVFSGKKAVVTDDVNVSNVLLNFQEHAVVEKYEENKVVIKAVTTHDRLLVLADVYYPTWRVYIDGKESKVYVTNYALRGVLIPTGEHTVEFKQLFF